MSNWLGIFFFSFVLVHDCTHSLKLRQVRIPVHVVQGTKAQLECMYDLEGESLYSVKWYKDGNEFYRYLPREIPPAQTYKLPGVIVDLENSSDAVVYLTNVTLSTTGRFRCEVSGEAPSFQTVTEHGDMVVVHLPDKGVPSITGTRPRYQIGEDWVRANCSSGRSKPAVKLEWFINDQIVLDPTQLRRFEPVAQNRDGLLTSTLGLEFRVDQKHFRSGDMKLKCVATLSTLFTRSNEETVEGDRPQKAPVLESRETVYASNSRADPVQGHTPSILLLLLIAAIANGCLQHLFLWPYSYDISGVGVRNDADLATNENAFMANQQKKLSSNQFQNLKLVKENQKNCHESNLQMRLISKSTSSKMITNSQFNKWTTENAIATR